LSALAVVAACSPCRFRDERGDEEDDVERFIVVVIIGRVDAVVAVGIVVGLVGSVAWRWWWVAFGWSSKKRVDS
jgi:uncharacterized protein (DUF983 family)